MKDAGGWRVPDFGAVDAASQVGDGLTGGGNESWGGVGAGSGQDTVVARKSGAHADPMEEPGAERSERPRLKIVVDEGLGRLAVVLQEECVEIAATKMVEDSGGDVDLAGKIRREGIAVKKPTRERFGLREAIGFLDEGGVQVDAS